MSRTEESGGPARDFQFVAKRVFDILTAAIALIVLSPLFLLVAIAIKIDSGGPVFSPQLRYCYYNQIIHVLKFRCATVGTTGKADRVTRIGRSLSRSSLDRLPMLINVLRGEMSIVGICSYVALPLVLLTQAPPAALQRSKLRPGLFCLAKLNSSHDGETKPDVKRQIEDDLSYVTSWSLWLDLRIIVNGLTAKSSYAIG